MIMNIMQLFRRLRPGVWSGWPEKAYQREGYQQRLQAVQEHLSECLDEAPPGPVRILSMCAGDGRDVIGAVRAHRRRKDVSAWLVELNSQSVELGKGYSVNAGLERSLKFINADATVYSTYKQIAQADIVLVCGVWGHVPAGEKSMLVRAISTLCKPGGAVIWTRGTSKGIGRVREIEALFAGTWWDKSRVTYTPDAAWAIATYRYHGPAHEMPADGQIFHFQKNAG
jgi:hypothetical protein